MYVLYYPDHYLGKEKCYEEIVDRERDGECLSESVLDKLEGKNAVFISDGVRDRIKNWFEYKEKNLEDNLQLIKEAERIAALGYRWEPEAEELCEEIWKDNISAERLEEIYNKTRDVHVLTALALRIELPTHIRVRLLMEEKERIREAAESWMSIASTH